MKKKLVRGWKAFVKAATKIGKRIMIKVTKAK